MNDAVRNLLNRLSRPSVEGRRRRFVATVLFSASAASSIPIIAALQSDAISDIRGAPGTFWLSGEAKGQVVLAATGGELASLALPISVDTGRNSTSSTPGPRSSSTTGPRATSPRSTGSRARSARKWTSPKITPSSDEPVLVPAGNSAYLVDRDRSTGAPSSVADPEANTSSDAEPVEVGPFDQWVGTRRRRALAARHPDR